MGSAGIIDAPLKWFCLHCIVLYCIVLVILYCIVSRIVLYPVVVQCVVLCCAVECCVKDNTEETKPRLDYLPEAVASMVSRQVST